MAERRRGGGQVLRHSFYSFVLIVLVACVDLCNAAIVVDVYRLIQYDLAGAPFGSRFAAINHHAAAFPLAPAVDLSRAALILPVRNINLTFIRDYITSRKPLGGLLLLLPPKVKEEGGGDEKSTLEELERLLVHSNIPYPVYFTSEDDKVSALLADIRKSDITGQPASATTGGYKLVVSSPEPRKIASPTITNIQGWLPGRKGDGDGSPLPTIAIVASYDTFGAAPALSVGSDSNGSGVVALLELARLFSRLYFNPKTRGSYNLLFGLTSGGPYNYNGTFKWLRSFDQRVRESIDYAICLNSIGSSKHELFMHVSKPPENAYIKKIYDGISDIAQELGLLIDIKHKKINISNPRVSWEHEQFSRIKVTALTLSKLSAPTELLEGMGSLHDTEGTVDEYAVATTVKVVAESLARHIYGHQGKKIDIFADGSSLAVNPFYIRSWMDLLSRSPRVAPFLSKNDPLILAFEKELSDHTVEVSVHHEVLDGIFTFYDSTTNKLNVYQVASVTFDLLVLLVLGSYLIILFSLLVVTTRGLDDLISIFRRPTPRKIKTA